MRILKRIICLGVIILYSCVFNNKISTYNELEENKADGSIQLVTTDTSVYFVDRYTYNDSSINIAGHKKKSGFNTSFEGELMFKDISYIQVREGSFFPTLAYVGLNIFLIGRGAGMVAATNNVEPIIKMADQGSCPYLYSWSGKEYQLEGEAFGAALGRALETQSNIVFRDLKADNNRLRIKITNERPETHFFNKIEFLALESSNYETVYSDNHNKFISVKNQRQPKTAHDRKNKDITNLLMSNDKNYWKSDLSSACAKFNFEDQLFITLVSNETPDSLSLIVSAINTEISSVVFSYLETLLGDELINFMKAADTDAEIIGVLKNTLEKSSLKIDVWDGTNWKYIDLIYPEANHIEFHKAIIIPAIKNENNEVKIRLRSLCDLWEIDAINFNDAYSRELIKHNPKILSYKDPLQKDFTFLEQKDDRYIKLLPGQSICFEFEDVRIENHNKLSYAIAIDGYLYEWVITKGNSPLAEIETIDTNSPKMQLVKQALKNMDSLLPIIYENWKYQKRKYVSKNF